MKTPDPTVHHKDFVRRVSRRAGYLEKEVEYVVDTAIQILRECLEEGECVRLHTLGKFYFKDMPPRYVRVSLPNVKQGNTVVVPSHKKLKFEISRAYDTYINNRRLHDKRKRKARMDAKLRQGS